MNQNRSWPGVPNNRSCTPSTASSPVPSSPPSMRNVPKSSATVVSALTTDSSPDVATSVETTGVCDTDWMSEVLPAANGPVTRILKT